MLTAEKACQRMRGVERCFCSVGLVVLDGACVAGGYCMAFAWDRLLLRCGIVVSGMGDLELCGIQDLLTGAGLCFALLSPSLAGPGSVRR